MTSSTFAWAQRWARRLFFLSLLTIPVLFLAGVLLDRGWGRDVLLIAPHSPEVVELNRSLWLDGDPVAEVYGNPMSEPTRVLLSDPELVIHPQEDPALTLLPTSTADRRPLQLRTVWWAARLGSAGLGIAAILLGLGWWLAVRAARGRRGSRDP